MVSGNVGLRDPESRSLCNERPSLSLASLDSRLRGNDGMRGRDMVSGNVGLRDPESRSLCNQRPSLSLASLDSRLRGNDGMRGRDMVSGNDGMRGAGHGKRECRIAGAGHDKRIITEMTDVRFSQSASSSLNSHKEGTSAKAFPSWATGAHEPSLRGGPEPRHSSRPGRSGSVAFLDSSFCCKDGCE